MGVSPRSQIDSSAATLAETPLVTAIAVLIGIITLYFGQDIFIPFALAVLLAFVLAPITNWLRRLRVPRVAAVLLAVTLAVTTIGALSLVVGTQLVQLADNLPRYQTTIKDKLNALKPSGTDSGILGRLSATFREISEDIAEHDEEETAAAQIGEQDQSSEAIPVIIQSTEMSTMEVIQTVAFPLIEPLLTAGIVIVFVIFVLLERDELRDRFIKLVGKGDLQRSTEALNEAASRVSRYLLMQVTINLTYGIPIAAGLYFIGVPNAILWGLLAAVLRFIPYLGPFLGALFPMALAFAVDPGWSMLLWTGLLFIVVELVSNNVMEPWLYGTSTGLSSLAILLAAIFWTTLWGPVGLVLATPLTVCFIVIGRYIPQLQFLDVLLGSDPVLSPEARLYQRILSGNTEEAIEIAEDYVDEHSLEELYDNMVIPALRYAQGSPQSQPSDIVLRRTIADGMIDVIDDMAEHARENEEAQAGAAVEAGANADVNEEEVQRPDGLRLARVICAGGRTELDLAAAHMVARQLEFHDVPTLVLSAAAFGEEALSQLKLNDVDVICLSYLSSRPQVFARQICRRLRRRAPHVKIVVCLWNIAADSGAVRELSRKMGIDAVATTVRAATNHILTLQKQHDHPATMQQARVPAAPQKAVAEARPASPEVSADGQDAVRFKMVSPAMVEADQHESPAAETPAAPATIAGG